METLNLLQRLHRWRPSMEGIHMDEMEQTLLHCARLMELSARTAPKSAGNDFIVLEVLGSEATAEVGRRMVEMGEKADMAMFVRDGKSVLASAAMLLVGVKEATAVGLDCRACGKKTCAEATEEYERNREGRAASGDTPGARPDEPGKFLGPVCAFRMLDMGIALGSAVKTASILNADNRIMYRAGVIARDMGLIDADYVMAVPLSATGKSVFFDR